MATLYSAGRVTVAQNSTKVYGSDTAWLLNGIKASDLIVIGGKVHEIQEVDTSSEITITNSYTGENITSGEYAIIRIARQVITAELAEEIQQLIDSYNSRESEINTKLAEHDEYIKIIKKSRIYVNNSGNLAQTNDPDTPTTIIIDGEEAALSTESDVQSLLDELGFGQ